MRIGVLYESDEWSDHKLAHELARTFEGEAQVQLIGMMDEGAISGALACDILVSRVFASAQFRGHGAALARMEELIGAVADAGVPLVNPGRAHGFEVDKVAAMQALANAGVRVPETFAQGTPEDLDLAAVRFPAVIKPVCGGRTTQTCIVQTLEEAQAFLGAAPDIPFMAQAYISPAHGFITRVEIIAQEPSLIVKRSVAKNGLSAYRFGSTYELYPDCPDAIVEASKVAAEALGFFFGSFDVIESEHGAFFIDANSVSNVSEDCTEIFGRDLMREYAQALAHAWDVTSHT